MFRMVLREIEPNLFGTFNVFSAWKYIEMRDYLKPAARAKHCSGVETRLVEYFLSFLIGFQSRERKFRKYLRLRTFASPCILSDDKLMKIHVK